MTAKLIALDWGTSSLRAYLMSDSGQVIASRQSNEGIMKSDDFKAVLTHITDGWEIGLPCIACGMIGSQQGWADAGYIATPASPTEISQKAIRIDALAGRSFTIIPGVKHAHANSIDVMRGEETQVIGAGVQNGLVVLPGTHSKWVSVSGGAIVSLRTYMTGEMFAVLKNHSILGRLIKASENVIDFDSAAFEKGAQLTLSNPAALMAELFSVRTHGLFGSIAATSLADYLSGLLLGAEIGLEKTGLSQADPITLIGDAALVARYEYAFKLANINIAQQSNEPPDNVPAAARGLFAIFAASFFRPQA